ncbi:galactoside alpha-(1,2)-fucosyltransferase 2-like [Paramacrobiotus metropolitanus]|uniref:galactoside alpha-(1,2)-fucosyltransferase 2-like n=1 Tax=Paramacrobiotus metropolitanus TaxID=2943436 RepID=UPI002445E6D5|nr:galactoside alpha-(1,2)-fucosyltransferase 2-like [Paramacrobiotus metropolitanus]
MERTLIGWLAPIFSALIFITYLTINGDIYYIRMHSAAVENGYDQVTDTALNISASKEAQFSQPTTTMTPVSVTVISVIPVSMTPVSPHFNAFADRLVNLHDDVKQLREQLRTIMSSRLAAARQYRIQQQKKFQDAYQDFNSSRQSGRFLTYRPPQGGLGNFMFEFATLVGCAAKNNRIPVLFTYEPKMGYFEGMNLSFIAQTALFPFNTIDAKTVGENGAGMFTPKFHQLNTYFPNDSVAITGYGQSWKYFDHASNEIRAMYTFRESIQEEAIAAILQGISPLYALGLFSASNSPVRAGIHIRRGDIVQDENQKRHGHVAASEEYLLRSALHIQTKYKNVVFFVLSNDIGYCRKLFREKNFVFISQKPAEVDMAVMTFMDVMIMSVGSYGWWGSYLSQAKEVFYFKNWPKPGSNFQKMVVSEDYFLPHWKGED